MHDTSLLLSSAQNSVNINSAIDRILSTTTVIYCILLVVIGVIAVLLKVKCGQTRRTLQWRFLRKLTIPVNVVAALVLVLTVYFANRLSNLDGTQMNHPSASQNPDTPAPETSTPLETEESSVPPETTLPPQSTEPSLPATPHMTDKTNPSNWNVKWEIITNGSVVSEYARPDNIHFSQESTYFRLPGISGFRGGNYRTGATYGSVNVINRKLEAIWQRDISYLPKGSFGAWTGAGWTGQPLVVQWDEETKAIMNLYPEKKAKKDLVEVIYATLDGRIYFYDIENGEYTRDPLEIGMAFKGSGALDPRGYPIMYVGSGDVTCEKKAPRMFIISLIDCSIMYEYGYENAFNFRSWCAFDASPLVHAETDTLIWPGENGLLYTIKLNTLYNKSAGTLSINPDKPVINRYMTDLHKEDYSHNLGMENSPIMVENYLYIGDNRGMYFCVDINTMKLAWTQEIKDDLNATAVFEWGDDGKGYLYLGTSLEYADGTSYMYKLDAVTGEIVWEKSIDNIVYNKNVSGGVLSSPLLGKKGTALEGMIFFHIAKTPSEYEGTMQAMDTETGGIIWEKTMKYAWSSPVAIYSDDGNAYVLLFDSVGKGHLMDPKTGADLCIVEVGSNVEASPAVFNDMIVVGTRGEKVYGIKIS